MKTALAIVFVVAGVIVASQLGAQTTTPAGSTQTVTGVPTAAANATVQNIVEITRAVPSGTTSVDVFTVPAGVTLVVTDVLVTNTGTAATCGGAVNRGGVAVTTTPAASTTAAGTPSTTSPTLSTSPTTASPATTSPTTTSPTTTSPTAATPTATTSAGTLTQTDSTVTGPLCVPAQTTTTLPLTTGIEFASGQVVQLLNAPVSATPTAAVAPGSLAFHLRGVLITLG